MKCSMCLCSAPSSPLKRQHLSACDSVVLVSQSGWDGPSLTVCSNSCQVWMQFWITSCETLSLSFRIFLWPQSWCRVCMLHHFLQTHWIVCCKTSNLAFCHSATSFHLPIFAKCLFPTMRHHSMLLPFIRVESQLSMSLPHNLYLSSDSVLALWDDSFFLSGELFIFSYKSGQNIFFILCKWVMCGMHNTA